MAPASRSSRRRSPRVRRVGEAEPSLAAGFASLLRSARGLHLDPDPLDAEGFASDVISTFPRSRIDEDDPEAFFGVRLVDFLVSKRTDDALAVLHALAAVTESESLARAAHAGALRLRVAGRADPPWAAMVGRARFVEAFAPADPFEEQDLIVATFEYPDRSRHALVFLVDQNFDGLVRQADLADDPEIVRHALVDVGDPPLRPVDAQEVADRLAQGLRVFDESVDPPCDEDLPPIVPLLRARLRALPRPIEPTRREFGDDERANLIAEFARSSEAGRSKRAVELADLFVSCRLGRLDADPLRWSPIAVELCLLDWLPRTATLAEGDIQAVPDALRRWVRFAARKKGLPADALAETLAAIDEFAPEFLSAVRDRSSFGPARAVAGAMLSEGVDLSVPDAVSAWIADFNTRPRAERDADFDGSARTRSARQGELPARQRAVVRAADDAARRAWGMPPAAGTLRGIDLAFLDPSDPDQRAILIEAEHPEFARALERGRDVRIGNETVDPRLHLALHEIIANQLWDGEPAETWAAATRLTKQGLARHDVLHMLMHVMSDFVFGALRDPLHDRSDEMRRAFDALGR